MSNKARKHVHRPLAEQQSQPSPFVIKRRAITAEFDDRQKQLFDQALIAILVADLSAEEIDKALVAARDTTIHVFSGQQLADMTSPAPQPEESCGANSSRTSPVCADSNPPGSISSLLVSCTNCYGHSLTLRGKLVQCDECGNIQPVIIDQPRIVNDGIVVQEATVRYFPSGEAAMATLNREKSGVESGSAPLLPEKPIVEVRLSGNSLLVVFPGNTIRRECVSHLVTLAISHLLQVLDTTNWIRQTLEDRLLKLSHNRIKDSDGGKTTR